MLFTQKDSSDEGLTLDTSAFGSLNGGQVALSTQLIKFPISIYFEWLLVSTLRKLHLVLSCNTPHQRSTRTVSLETYPLYEIVFKLRQFEAPFGPVKPSCNFFIVTIREHESYECHLVGKLQILTLYLITHSCLLKSLLKIFYQAIWNLIAFR